MRPAWARPTPAPIVRLMMALKLASLAQGASGVRPETVAMLEALLERDLIPVVPAQGSVGASGDLAPLAHMAAAMIGASEILVEGRVDAGRQGPCRGRPRAAAPWSQGRAGALERHAVLDRLCARRPVRGRDPFHERRGRRRLVDRGGQGLGYAVRRPHPQAPRPPRPDRDGRGDPAAHGRLGDPRLASDGRRARAGPLLPPVSAAGDGGGPRPAPPGRRDAANRVERRVRQPARLPRETKPATTRCSRAATSTPSRSPSPPT